MAQRTAKVCLIGDFGVGKTSLVARYVHQQFSESYLTTVGVKIDTKPVTLASGDDLKLVIWDIAGNSTADATYSNYVRGAAGYLLVADGTRAPTLETALSMQQQLADELGDIPWVGLLNKVDLIDDWEVETPVSDDDQWRATSAMTGEHVEEAFVRLAELIAAT